MNKILSLVFAITATLFTPISNANIEKDKILHFGVSFGAGKVLNQRVFDDYRYSLATCFAIGLGKEIYDEIDYNGFDEKDLLADALGCGLGVWLDEAFFQDNLSFDVNHQGFNLAFEYKF